MPETEATPLKLIPFQGLLGDSECQRRAYFGLTLIKDYLETWCLCDER